MNARLIKKNISFNFPLTSTSYTVALTAVIDQTCLFSFLPLLIVNHANRKPRLWSDVTGMIDMTNMTYDTGLRQHHIQILRL